MRTVISKLVQWVQRLRGQFLRVEDAFDTTPLQVPVTAMFFRLPEDIGQTLLSLLTVFLMSRKSPQIVERSSANTQILTGT